MQTEFLEYVGEFYFKLIFVLYSVCMLQIFEMQDNN